MLKGTHPSRLGAGQRRTWNGTGRPVDIEGQAGLDLTKVVLKLIDHFCDRMMPHARREFAGRPRQWSEPSQTPGYPELGGATTWAVASEIELAV